MDDITFTSRLRMLSRLPVNLSQIAPTAHPDAFFQRRIITGESFKGIVPQIVVPGSV
jgi:hypothetical protein